MSLGDLYYPRQQRFDPELVGLIGFNVSLLLAYFLGQQQPLVIVYGYFVQSVFVGIQTWLQQAIFIYRARRRKRTPEGDREVALDSFMLWFFPVHFGGFHFVYMIFLLVAYRPEKLAPYTLSEVVGYATLWSAIQLVIYLWRELSPQQPNRASPTIFFAYLRVVPMHLFILLGGLGFGSFATSDLGFGVSLAFVVFVGLKTIGDVVLYRWGYAEE